MVIYNSFKNTKLIELIQKGGIGVIPTDTIYGLVAVASDVDAVEKIYEIKGRDSEKPLIVLISNVKDIYNFGIKLTNWQIKFLGINWPGKLSVILPTESNEFEYLSRCRGSITFRLPDDKKLISLLQKTGPLVAPSANPQGFAPAENVDEVFNYFIGKIDFVVDGGPQKGSGSTLIDIRDDSPKILRQGETKVRNI